MTQLLCPLNFQPCRQSHCLRNGCARANGAALIEYCDVHDAFDCVGGCDEHDELEWGHRDMEWKHFWFDSEDNEVLTEDD